MVQPLAKALCSSADDRNAPFTLGSKHPVAAGSSAHCSAVECRPPQVAPWHDWRAVSYPRRYPACLTAFNTRACVVIWPLFGGLFHV